MLLRKNTFMANLEALHIHYPPVQTGMLTTESIAFQKNDPFGPQLEAVIQKYKDLIDSGVKRLPLARNKELKKQLEDVVFARLGIKAELHLNSYLAATIPNVYIPHNPVINEDARWIFEVLDNVGGQSKLRKQKPMANLGTVNTETVRVTGWFSQQTVPVYMNMYELFKDFDMTVPEVTAILLHELGHDFNGILFSANVNTTNQIIADIVKHVSDKDRGGDVKYIYSKIKEVYPKASVDIAEGLASGDKVVMNIAAYRLIVGVTDSLMDQSSYDRNSFEALADNFATRFGYSLALVTSLEKLEKMYPEYDRLKEMANSQLYVMLCTGFLSILYLALSGAAGVFYFLMCALLSYFFGYLTVLIFNLGTVTGQDMTYDKIRDRYTRIRMQLVEFIKDPELSISSKQGILDQIKTMDAIISEKRLFVGFIEKFSKAVFPKDRKAFASIQNQQEIEGMIANDIFVSANRLALK